MLHRNTNTNTSTNTGINRLLFLLFLILCCASCAARKQTKLKALPIHTNEMAALAEMEFNQNLPVFAIAVAPVRIERQAEEAFLQLMGITNREGANVCLSFPSEKNKHLPTSFIQLASLSPRFSQQPQASTDITSAEAAVEQHRKAVAGYLESQFLAVKNFALLQSEAQGDNRQQVEGQVELQGERLGEHMEDGLDSGPFLVETNITSYKIEAEHGGKYNSRKPFAETDGDIQRAIVTVEAKISDKKKGVIIASLPFTHHVDRGYSATLVNGQDRNQQQGDKANSNPQNITAKNEARLKTQQCRLAQETLQEAIQTAAEIVTTKVYRQLISHYQAGLSARR